MHWDRLYLVVRVRRERRARNATVIDDFIGARS
jgi:hypothetical protein